jgi:HK97 family phage portal protein
MRIFGLPVPFTGEKKKSLATVAENRAGWYRLYESFAGAWQTNYTLDRSTILSYNAVYACITLIASDVSKLAIKVVRKRDGIWVEEDNPAYTPVLRRPNLMQNRIQFIESWVISKLARGNTYILKGRDARGVVNRLWVLDPTKVVPAVSDDGEVFYKLSADNLAALTEDVVVPSREIIHDRFNTLFHPLVGTSPIYAAGTAASQGVNIQNNSSQFFGNKSQPGGVLTAPGAISDETAARLKASWDTNFTGENAGKVAVFGDGLKYERMMMSAEESQLIEQLKWTAEVVCSVFHVPPYKIGVGPLPSFNNIQALNTEYYSQCLQKLIEDLELCLDEGLEMAIGLGTEFDLDGLLRMDSTSQMNFLKEGIGAGVLAPNEARRKMDLPAVRGGDSPFLQQQNFSLEALAKRDAQEDPFGTAKAETPVLPPPVEEPDTEARFVTELSRKAAERLVYA